jgi:hypothetical protein
MYKEKPSLYESNDVLGHFYYIQEQNVRLIDKCDIFTTVDGFKYVEPVVITEDHRVFEGCIVRLADK